MKTNATLTPVFICGVQRSGTTLLVEMLNHLEQVQLLPQETHLYPLFWHPFKGIVPKKPWNKSLPFYFLQANRGWTLPEGQQFLDIIKNTDFQPSDVNDLMMELFDILPVNNNVVYTGEKTPAHIYYLHLLMKKFPNSKIFIANRDPRAIALSEIIKTKDNHYNAFNFAVRWASAYLLYKNNLGRWKKNGQLFYVRYEDILHQPEKVAKEMCTFLKVPFNSEMLEMKVTNSSFGSGAKGFDTSRIYRWKTDLPSTVIAEIDYYLKDWMIDEGYEVEVQKNWKPSFKQFSKKMLLTFILKICTIAPATFHYINKKKSKYAL